MHPVLDGYLQGQLGLTLRTDVANLVQHKFHKFRSFLFDQKRVRPGELWSWQRFLEEKKGMSAIEIIEVATPQIPAVL